MTTDKVKELLEKQKAKKKDILGEPMETEPKQDQKKEMTEEEAQKMIMSQIQDMRDPGLAMVNLIGALQKNQDILLDLGQVIKDRLDHIKDRLDHIIELLGGEK